MTDRRWFIALWATAAIGCVALYAASLIFGDLNQDEGWYLYAGRLVTQGRLPYLDFASTQGPLASMAYALAQPLVDRWGVGGGRLFTALLGLAGCAAGGALAARLAPAGARGLAALLACMLSGLNLYQCYFTTVVKTYAITALLLSSGFLLLASIKPRRGAGAALLAGALLGLAAGTRTSAAMALPVVFLALAWRAWRRRPEPEGRVQALLFALGAIAAVGVVFLPLLIRAPRALWFGLVEYHSGRAAGGLGAYLAYRAGFVARVTQAYYLPIGLLAVLCARRWWGIARAPADEAPALPPGALWGSVAAISLLHAAAPFPYDDYQVIVLPLAAAGLGAMLARLPVAWPGVPNGRRWLAGTLLLLSLAAAGSSPMLQGWFVWPRDRIWWPLRTKPPLATLQRTAAMLKERAKVNRGDLMLTQDTYLAVETGARVPHGLELGPFSYFPEWDREHAEACHVLNRQMMTELLQACPAEIAAFSGYGLAIRLPEVTELAPEEQARLWALVRSGYEPFAEVPRFGQADTTLRILKRLAAQP
jgi:hypothetical protein